MSNITQDKLDDIEKQLKLMLDQVRILLSTVAAIRGSVVLERNGVQP